MRILGCDFLHHLGRGFATLHCADGAAPLQSDGDDEDKEDGEITPEERQQRKREDLEKAKLELKVRMLPLLLHTGFSRCRSEASSYQSGENCFTSDAWVGVAGTPASAGQYPIHRPVVQAEDAD